MNPNPLTQSVERFAQRLVDLPEAALERPWAWQSYDSEGVRFAFFRTYEDLRDLAARMRYMRSENDQHLSEAQHILAQYHAAYRDLQAALLGLTAEQMELSPGEDQWPVHAILAHLLGADVGFYVLVQNALDRLRGEMEPARATEEEYGRLTGLDEAAFDAMMEGSVESLINYFDLNHNRVIDSFAMLGAQELDGLSLFWEDEPYPVRFRLHRFDSHMRQHTIQVDKTLAALGLLPGESRRLLRLIYSALAEVEGALIGIDPTTVMQELEDVANSIDHRLREMEAVASG
jgi:hypothetical protein